MITVGNPDRKREPPAEAQRELQQAFPECFYEWMPRAKRWAVKRKISWVEADRLAKAGLIREVDVLAHLEARKAEGFDDFGDGFVVHAFTLRGPKGEFVEPSSAVIEALRAADTQNPQSNPGGIRAAFMSAMRAQLDREAELDRWFSDQIEQAVSYHDAALRGLPAEAYPVNPIGKDEQGNAGS